MSRGLVITLAFLAWSIQAISQDMVIDSLKQSLVYGQSDSLRARTLATLCQHYKWDHPDSAFFYGEQALSLARKTSDLESELMALDGISLTHHGIGNHVRSLELSLEGLRKADEAKFLSYMSVFRVHLGSIYFDIGEHTKAINYYKEAWMYADSASFFEFEVIPIASMAQAYAQKDDIDSAFYYAWLADSIADQQAIKWPKSYSLEVLGQLFMEIGDYNNAEIKFKEQFYLPEGSNALLGVSKNYELLAEVYDKTGRLDSSLIYADKSLEIALETGIYTRIIEANLLLSRLYEPRDKSMSLKYAKHANLVKEQLDDLRVKTSTQSFIASDEREKLLQSEKNQALYQSSIQKLWTLIVSIGLLSIVILSFILYRNSQNRKRTNSILVEKNEELEKAFDQLKSTQAQLIQSEKMASLGELTAGIAHEIQNPLNFVNNFSEVNSEMLEELKAERSKVKGKRDEKLEDEIISDVTENQVKINEHGKRASEIVKAMLQHSRTSAGEKELTDINALCDEYLRLAYHGMRAKDKSFNADFKMELDESLPKVIVVPQDIGRVLLNLINNAFYACTQRVAATEALEVRGGLEYKPLVTLTTKKLSDKIEISVKDNGPGIPKEIQEKIFQPFFTTKPTGQGTGLGLSLSYDIVKAHGGTIELFVTNGRGSEFIITLPA